MKAGNKYLILIILLGFLLRLLFLLLVTDLNSVNHFEYGAIAENLHHGNGYALYNFEDGKFNIGVSKHGITYKSAFMPPLYTEILYLFFFIKDITARNFSVLLFQTFISVILICLVYNLTKKLFDRNAALFAALITAILPEFIYAANQSGTTIIFQTGIIVVFIFTNELNTKRNKITTSIILGITLGLLILLRSEVLVFAIILFIYLLFNKQVRAAMIIAFTALLVVAPWQIRNIITFREMVPLSTSLGTNLYRGHNPYAIGVWSDEIIEEKRLKFKNDPNYEVRMNEYLVNKALQNIYRNPVEELKYVFEKIYNLWLFNPNDPRSSNYYYLIPWFILLSLFSLSLIKSFNWNKQKFIFLFLIYFNVIVIVFFCLPRYQTMMKIALIPFAGEGIRILYDKIVIR